MLVRQIWRDPRLKKICDIEADVQPYCIAVLSRFRTKNMTWTVSRNYGSDLETLVKKGTIKGEALALDSTFIKAFSRRNLDNRTSYSDPEWRIGRAVKAKDLGYRLHLAVDAKSELPVGFDCSFSQRERKETFHQPVYENITIRDTWKTLGWFAVQRSKSKRKRISPWSIAGYSLAKKSIRRRYGYSEGWQEISQSCPSKIQNSLQETVTVERVFSRFKNLASLTQHIWED
jgi:hypothetical protein